MPAKQKCRHIRAGLAPIASATSIWDRVNLLVRQSIFRSPSLSAMQKTLRCDDPTVPIVINRVAKSLFADRAASLGGKIGSARTTNISVTYELAPLKLKFMQYKQLLLYD
jgi:hypothetical protein